MQLLNFHHNASRYTAQAIITMDAVEQAMRAGVKAAILCNPHNPLGKVWTRDELEGSAVLCDKYGVYLLSDEVHGDIVMDGNH